MSTTTDKCRPQSILLGKYDAVLGLDSRSLAQPSFSAIIDAHESTLSLDSLCAVLQRREMKFRPLEKPGENPALDFSDLQFPCCQFLFCERTFAAHLEWLLMRGANIPRDFWKDVGIRGGMVLFSALHVINEYSRGSGLKNLCGDVWACLLHGALLGEQVGMPVREELSQGGGCACGMCHSPGQVDNNAPSKKRVLTTEDSASTTSSDARVAIDSMKRAKNHEASTDDGLHQITHNAHAVESASAAGGLRWSHFSPASVPLLTAAQLCRRCLMGMIMAVGTRAESGICARHAKAERGSDAERRAVAVSTKPIEYWTMLAVLLRQPVSPLRNALFAIFLNKVPSHVRKNVYHYTNVGVNMNVWFALLTSYVRSGGEITIAELNTLPVSRAQHLMRSLTSAWFMKYEDLGKFPHTTRFCTNSTCRGLVNGSLVDPSASGFCAAVKCGDARSTIAVCEILEDIACAHSSPDFKQDHLIFNAAAAGVARWRLCKETGIGWGSGTGAGIMSRDAGELETETTTLLMHCITETQIPFANDTCLELESDSLLHLVLTSLKELCGIKEHAH